MLRATKLAAFALSLAFGGCSSHSQGLSSRVGHGTDEPSSEGERDSQEAAPAEPEPPPPPPEVVALDLASFLHFAEARAAGGPAADLGTPAGHPFTLGRHRTGWADEGSEGEITFVTFGRRRRGTLHIASETADGGQLHLRISPAGADRVEARVNGQVVGRAEVDPDASWTTATITIDDGRLAPGDNALELRLQGRRRRQAPRLDWIWLTRAGDAPSGAPRWPEARTGSGHSVVVLPAGTTLSYSVVVPAGARLSSRLAPAGATGTRVTVQARLEDNRSMSLADVEVSSGETGTLSAQLEELAGQLVRIEMEATNGDALLGEPCLRQLESAARPSYEQPSSPSPTDARNLIVVLIDTLRADHLSTYNPDTRVRAEAFDRLAASGTVFEAAQVQENWTKPSVATLLTSLYPSSHNAKSAEAILPDAVETIGELLQDRGFVTAAFIANGYVSDRFGFDQGWDTYRNYVREGRRNRADAVVDDTLEWLERRPEDQPFFLYVHTIDPHVPYVPPRRYREMYDPDPYRGPIVASRTAQLLADIKLGRLSPNERDRFHLEALYDGEITYGDDHFGRLMTALEERGILDDTLIWVTSDHGEEFFEHGSVGHGHSLYQELLHVPLVASFPGSVPAGARVGYDVGLIDVLPTSFDILGVEPHGDAQGRSLVPMIRGRRPHLYQAAFSDFLDGGRAARAGDLKIIVQGSELSLFDLSEDPGEDSNVAADRPFALRHMLTLLSMHVGSAEEGDAGTATRRRRVHRRREESIDPETLEQLRALGYML